MNASLTDEAALAAFEAVGGPAYPRTWMLPSGGELKCPGMTLRDWFAGQALAGILAMHAHPQSKGFNSTSGEELAADAYRVADAILAARKAGAA